MNFEISENTVLAVPFILKGRRLEENERVRFRCMFRNHEGDFPYVLDMEEDNKGENGPDGKFTISLDTSKYGIRPGRYSFDLSLVLESGSLITLMRKSDCQIKINATEDGLEKPNGDVFFGADFIVEEGTKDGWTYRKWNSGIAECWKSVSVTYSAAMASNSNYASCTLENAIVYPENLFVDVPIVSLVPFGAGCPTLTGVSPTKTSVGVLIKTEWAVTDGSIWIHIQGVGRWK